jgi:hypothetical protein
MSMTPRVSGSIVNVTSIEGVWAAPGCGLCRSEGGRHQLRKTAFELAPRKIGSTPWLSH